MVQIRRMQELMQTKVTDFFTQRYQTKVEMFQCLVLALLLLSIRAQLKSSGKPSLPVAHPKCGPVCENLLHNNCIHVLKIQ